MMILLSHLRVCAVALFFGSALANPGWYTASELVTRSSGGPTLNPRGVPLQPQEMMMTNGERLRRGLPLNKPHFRRAGTS